MALIDTGVNPYAPAFRDRSSLAQRHPSTYIPGYPTSAKALPITLDVAYATAIKRDASLWKSVDKNKLYWIPGTKIVAAISLCLDYPQEADDAYGLNGLCGPRLILDDDGHATMTASRATGLAHSLAPNARLAVVEGIVPESVVWAAKTGWIDVQSNSWGVVEPGVVNDAVPADAFGIPRAFSYAASRNLTLAASGNGTGLTLGAAPNPTFTMATAPPGVLMVGGHDNGRMTLWSGSPPDIAADAYGGYGAPWDSTGAMKAVPETCCTSSASPYAAGGAAALVLEARRILGDRSTGIDDGVVARGKTGLVRGPLSDGRLTLTELKLVLMRTAEARPAKGRDDGLLHWAGEPRAPDFVDYGPGANPFCPVCTTTPMSWTDVPAEFNAFPHIGYGAINERSVALGLRVLRGQVKLPVRPNDDAQFAASKAVRLVNRVP